MAYCDHEECDMEPCLYEDDEKDEEELMPLEESFIDFGFGADGDRG